MIVAALLGSKTFFPFLVEHLFFLPELYFILIRKSLLVYRYSGTEPFSEGKQRAGFCPWSHHVADMAEEKRFFFPVAVD